MTPVWFYHLEKTAIEAALPPLLEKCLQRGWRALVRGTLPERLDALDQALWSWREDAFVPHGVEGRDAGERQPVLLTTSAGRPNGAQALFLIDGAAPTDAAAFERTHIVFDGRDEAALVHARLQWKAAKEAGHAVAYWKESAGGRWEQQA
jgi:DNA polymerase-3 subunit chi